jgi:hypothetical protein
VARNTAIDARIDRGGAQPPPMPAAETAWKGSAVGMAGVADCAGNSEALGLNPETGALR